MKHLLLCSMFITFAGFSTTKDSVIVLDAKQKSFDFWDNPATSYFVDSSRNLSFESIQQQSFLTSKNKNQNFGFTNASIWVKTKVKTKVDRSFIVGSSYNLIDTLAYYLVNDKNQVEEFKINGRLVNHKTNEIDSHSRVFPFSIVKDKTYTVYFKIAGRENKKVSLAAYESHYFYSTYQKETWFWAIYVGFYLSMILLQIIFYVITQKNISLYYLLYLVSFLLVEISRGNGMIGERYLWPENTWLKFNALLLAVPISTALGILFYINGLQLKKYGKIIFRLLCADIVFVLLLGIYQVFLTKNVNVTQQVLLSALMSDFLVLIACIVALKKGNRVAIFYLIGTICFFMGILFTTLWHLGIVPNKLIFISSLNFGCMLEVCFFTAAIAFEYRLANQKTVASQSAMIAALETKNKEISDALLKGQTIERQRVAQDLHDNLGSTLSGLMLNFDAIDKSKMDAENFEVFQNLKENLAKTYQEVRLLSHNLLPIEFEKLGLIATLQGFVRNLNKNSKIHFNLNILSAFERLDPKIEFELYSICLELVNNILKHSQATEAIISIGFHQSEIELSVSDNGIGVFLNQSDGKGLKNIQTRLDSLHGKWELSSDPKSGTANKIIVPIIPKARA